MAPTHAGEPAPDNAAVRHFLAEAGTATPALRALEAATEDMASTSSEDDSSEDGIGALLSGLPPFV
jgi:hypothetical protein